MCCNKAAEIYCTNIFHAGILPNYTEQELFAATDGWASTNLLSEGGFGKVFIGKLRATTVAESVQAGECTSCPPCFQYLP